MGSAAKPAALFDNTGNGRDAGGSESKGADVSCAQVANQLDLGEMIGELSELRAEMLALESSGLNSGKVGPDHQASARNLLHYLALRRHDLRGLQSQLASLGLSSLGRTEAQVLSTVDAVIAILECLGGGKDSSGFCENTSRDR